MNTYMHSVIFIDTEIEYKSKKILDIGAIKDNNDIFHKNSLPEFIQFLNGNQFICGHNILHHDIQYIGHAIDSAGIPRQNIIDTLFLSPLFFPTHPSHALLKDDKIYSEEANNPLNDAIKAKDLFYDEVAVFSQTDETFKQILYLLLHNSEEFCAFFNFLNYQSEPKELQALIYQKFENEICTQADLSKILSEFPVELAYCLSLIEAFVKQKKSFSTLPPWVLKNYPHTEHILHTLRDKPCISGCIYCDKALNPHKALKKYFGFDAFRTYNGEPLQENAIKAAVHHKSLLAVFPTGGGKSITFQIPALMSGENTRGLTVVISPLQSLMKDQVDNLEKTGITEAVTINGLLDPVERAKSLQRVEDGSACILYISPESLRSKTIEQLILGRNISRFVIDEAHCFSSWGQDFRVDYLYIGDFIRHIQETRNLHERIPVSCFTATAKQKVIEDICRYFKEKLSLDLEIYTTKTARTNLTYKVFEKKDEEKYQALRDLIEKKACPTIVYVSRTHKASQLALWLNKDGFKAKAYHGKMDTNEKTASQNAFISGEVSIMVATSAFGMGVDKKDVGMVIHYEISDSLENYIQEAGRAGRDENITAECFVLFNEDDIDKHFILLNQTKLSIKEIKQVWKAIKEITRFRSKVSISALEIARKAGWDDSIADIETRITSTIAALEDAGYLRRGQNTPRVFATSILSKNVQEAIDKINASVHFEDKQKEKAIRIIKKLFAQKSRKNLSEETPESRIDYISDHLGIVKDEVISIVNLLREEKILGNTKDLTAFIKTKDNKNRSLNILQNFCKIENFLISVFQEEETHFSLKELKQQAETSECGEIKIPQLITLINFWKIKKWIKHQNYEHSKNHISVLLLSPKEKLKEKLQKRHILAKLITEYLYKKMTIHASKEDETQEQILVEFSVYELKETFEKQNELFQEQVSYEDIEDALLYLSKIDAIDLEGGFLVIYNRLTIERLEQNNKKQYTEEDYHKLKQFYENKIQQIHIVSEYAKKMITDYKIALQFVEDYFQLNYSSFLKKYFPDSKNEEIRLKITPRKFRQIFGELSAAQLNIINDNQSQYIVVAAGPGSGKTRVLVHKLASLIFMEDIKYEQLLMLTFSRAAATEFKKRLLNLIGSAANYIEIKTFHSYCFDLLGNIGSLEKSDEIIRKTIAKIRNKDVETNRITKTVLVIDEAQDMSETEFGLVKILMEQNEDMRVIAVGDDDQNIYEFRGANSKYLKEFITLSNAKKYELTENYRSKNNLVHFASQYVKQIKNRLKENPVFAKQTENGTIQLFRYQNGNFLVPFVQDILTTDLTGTTCIITKTNEEALQVTGLLLQNNIPAKLIQNNDGFNLYNLLEMRFFLQQLHTHGNTVVISDEVWENAKQALKNTFHRSTKSEICSLMIQNFETVNPKKKYFSDLETFIRESKPEDFLSVDRETVFVSTIHKTKGKEFDTVFLLLQNFTPSTEEEKRQVYVAMTRAKNTLHIHLNSSFLDTFTAENLYRTEKNGTYPVPDTLFLHPGLKDVWLDYLITKQHLVDELMSGDDLEVRDFECLNQKGYSVLKFSKGFTEKIEELKKKNYFLRSAKVNFIVYWLKEGTEKEIKIVLPELYFQKAGK